MPLFFSALIGFAVGMVVSWTLAYAAPPMFYFYHPIVKIVEGCILGAGFGGLIGSISGDPNRASGGISHNLLVAAIFGIMGGAIGVTRGDLVFDMLRALHIPTPFNR